MKKETIINIFIGTIIFIIIIIATVLTLNQMGEKIAYECSKVDNEGIIKFWDADIDCSIYYENYNHATENSLNKKEIKD